MLESSQFKYQDSAIQLKATVPVVREKAGWLEGHAKQKAHAQKISAKVVMIGDSMIRMWPEQQLHALFGRKNVLKLGVSGDSTQHVLWRVKDLDLSKQQSSYALLMVGTNNIFLGDSAADTLAGIKTIIAEIQRKLCGAKLIVVGVLPRGENLAFKRDEIAVLNSQLMEIENIAFLDASDILDSPDGGGKLVDDMLHLSDLGYEALTKRLEAFMRYL